MVYEWKRSMKVNAGIAAAELERIRSKNGDGILDPEEVVFASVDEDAVLHNLFQWDDTKAAHGYRIEQAKFIIRNLVTVEEAGDKSIETRAIVSTGSRVYQPIRTVLSDEELRRNLLNSALAELNWFKAKYRQLTELSELFDVIDNLTLSNATTKGE